jgi:hypothetical protein
MVFAVSDLTALLKNEPYVLNVLKSVKAQGPNGAFVAAGFVRNRLWDSFYKQSGQFSEADIDVVYFDDRNIDPESDYEFERRLSEHLPVEWQVRNQARMHHFGGYEPFVSLEAALMHWAETATSVGVRLSDSDEFEYVAPFGFDDLFDHILRITPAMYASDRAGFKERLKRKGWQNRWPSLKVINTL